MDENIAFLHIVKTTRVCPLNSTFPTSSYPPWSSHMMSTMLGRGLAVSKSAGRSLSAARLEAATVPPRSASPPTAFRFSTS